MGRPSIFPGRPRTAPCVWCPQALILLALGLVLIRRTLGLCQDGVHPLARLPKGQGQ